MLDFAQPGGWNAGLGCACKLECGAWKFKVVFWKLGPPGHLVISDTAPWWHDDSKDVCKFNVFSISFAES